MKLTVANERPLRIAFRTDASIQIGTGHVMRCLTLADALRARGAETLFLCRPHPGHLLELISGRGHRAVALPAPEVAASLAQPAHADWLGTTWARDAEHTRAAIGDEALDWLVVDHYALDSRWEAELRKSCAALMAIDDLADRPHDCDLLLDQNLGRRTEDYASLLRPGTPVLVGPQNALLRPEFTQLRAESLARRTHPQLEQVLITMGGVDKHNVTGQVLDALDACTLPPQLRLTVVMGPHAPCLAQVQTRAALMSRPTRVLVGVTNMARLMVDSDLAIGAAGSTSWERCCLGLPSYLLVLAANQSEAAAALQDRCAAMVVQSVSEIAQKLQTQLQSGNITPFLRDLSVAAARVCSGNGISIVREILLQRSV